MNEVEKNEEKKQTPLDWENYINSEKVNTDNPIDKTEAFNSSYNSEKSTPYLGPSKSAMLDILSKRRFIVRSSKYPIRTKRNSKLQLFPFIEIKNKDFGFKECILEIPKTRDEREMNQIVSYLYNN